jgi:cytidylate kinase
MARSVQQLVNQNFLRWMEEQKVSSKRRQADSHQKPMLVMSREFGGRGAEIGRKVATKLGFQYHSQELVHEIAREARVRRQLVESLDERARDGIEQWVTELLDGESFAPNDYLKNLSKVVGALGRHGKGVIVGRGAHFLLDPRRTLRVRTYAPLEERIGYIAGRRDLTAGEARALVLKIDAERVAFYRQHFNADVANPLHYDLLLNTSSLSIPACVDIVVRAFRAKLGTK